MLTAEDREELTTIYHAATACVRGECQHEYDYECAAEWIAARVQQAEADRDEWKRRAAIDEQQASDRLAAWDEARARAEAAESERDALRERLAAVEALADEWENPAEVYALRKSAAPRIRAVLAAPGPLLDRVKAEDGAALIAAERRRQIEVEGYTVEHDAEHSVVELMDAAIAYLSPNDASAWPWGKESFKPEVPQHRVYTSSERRPQHGTVRDLTKAGALIAAMIDQLLRRAEQIGADRG